MHALKQPEAGDRPAASEAGDEQRSAVRRPVPEYLTIATVLAPWVCWAANVLTAPGVDQAAVSVSAIPGVEARNGGSMSAGGVGVWLGDGVSVRVGVRVAVGCGVGVAVSAGMTASATGL